MIKCQKCNKELEIMIEDEDGILCIKCHPDTIGDLLISSEIFKKLQNTDFKKE